MEARLARLEISGLPEDLSAGHSVQSPTRTSPDTPNRGSRRLSRGSSDDGGEPDSPLREFARCAPQRDTTAGWKGHNDRPVVVGIAGGTGSGKTTVAAEIAQRLGEEHLLHLQHDSYYRSLPASMPLAERAKTNFDHPDALETSLLVQHLKLLLAGKAVRVPKYDFATHQRQGDEVKEPAQIILVEGILIYSDEELRQMLDIKIFVDTESDVRFIRRLQRDISERGRDVNSVVDQYQQTVRPMHIQFVEPSKRHADLIIPTGYNSVALSMVVARLEALLEWGNEPPALSERSKSTPRRSLPLDGGSTESTPRQLQPAGTPRAAQDLI